jgi:C4-dicarboxylate-specific signal transduction histidine kinase
LNQRKKPITSEDDALNRRELLDLVRDQITHDEKNLVFVEEESFTLMRELKKDDPERSKYYKEAAQKARKARLKLGRISESLSQDGTVKYKPKPTGLVEVVNDSLHACSGMFFISEIKAPSEYKRADGSELYFRGDYVRMFIVMVNLFANSNTALRETPDPRVDVRISRRNGKDCGRYAKLTVSNNGPRFSFDDPEEVFGLYKTTGGTGLGLAICRDIIQDTFNGSIYARNRKQGGVAFDIELPLIGQKKE